MMRVYWRQEGGHIHMRVFMRGGKMGNLCCRDDEFEMVKAAMLGCDFRKDDFCEPFEQEEESDAHRSD
jgi:hypothetical protein